MHSLFFLILSVTLKLISSKSLTIVIDTTVSMQEDIDIIKRNMRTVLEGVRGVPHIQNYILVPFNDPDVGTPVISNTSETFLSSIRGLTTRGGTDCPENTLAGIRKGLEVSYKGSYIYVFTDAFAKDYIEASTIRNLCENTGSQVVIFLSGYCKEQDGNIDIYRDIAKYCSGTVIELNPSNFRKAFDYMRDTAALEWSNVVTYAPVSDGFEFDFSVNSLTKNLMIIATGLNPFILVDGQMRNDEKGIYDRKSLMAIFLKSDTGTYKTTIRCEKCNTVTVYKRNLLPFRYGFSTKCVTNFKETSARPIPDATNYLLIFSSMSISWITLETFDGTSINLQIQPVSQYSGMYYTHFYVNPTKRFRILIRGFDSSTSDNCIGSTKIFEPQIYDINPPSSTPVIDIIRPDNIFYDFGATITLASRITAYPTPTTWWETSDGMRLQSEDILLEMPTVYVSYVTVENITSNTTIYCKSRNSIGEESQSLDIFVNRTAILDVIQEPNDATFEYESEGKLFCQVNAYPEANVKWYHNDTLIESSDNIEINDPENALVIKKMSLNDVGEYKCVVSNTLETKELTAEIRISGLEPPELEMDSSEINVKPDDAVEIACRINKGRPNPIVSWKFKSNNDDDFKEIPYGITTDNDRLTIDSIKTENGGTYKCMGVNDVGEDSKEIDVKIRYAPMILDNEEKTIVIKENHHVVLTCDVNAEPKATVRWELSQDDVIIPFDHRHYTDDRNRHRFIALWKDSGNYNCIAENELGSTEKTVRVNVLVAPHIQQPPSEKIMVQAGSRVTLPCNVRYGNPVPTTRWVFTPPNSSSSVILRGNTTTLLKLESVTKEDEGSYLCIAENSVDIDRIKIDLTVL